MSVFRSDDGREIEEADLRAVVNSWYRAGAYKRVLAALALKPAPTCGAVIQGVPVHGWPCVLPPPDKDGFHEGHHAYLRAMTHGELCGQPLGQMTLCLKPESDSVHWKGHSPNPEVWREP